MPEPTDEAPAANPTGEVAPPPAPRQLAAHHLDAGHHHGHAQLPHWRLLEEIKRRNVGRVAILYVVVSYVVLEVFEMFFHLLEMPAWAGRIAVLIAVIGFPIALLLAWAYEITPEGLRPTEEVPPQKSITRLTGRRLDRAITIVLAIALTYFVFDKFYLSKHTAEEAAAAATAAQSPALLAIPEKSVAVLPFIDLSENHDQAYFSDGLSEELIDKLAQVDNLRVPARTSAFYFKGKQATIEDIGKMLRVAHVLEGSVRKSGDTLRITAQLIRVDGGYHLWSETFDKKITDIFKMQDEIAKAVVSALRISMSSYNSSQAITTNNPEAYTVYLQGLALNHTATSRLDYQKAADAMRQATRLDPNFADAWGWLAMNLADENYFWEEPPSTNAEVEMRQAAQRALQLGPNVAAAHAASASVSLFADRNLEAAAVEFRKSHELDAARAGYEAALADVLFDIHGASDEVLGLYLNATDIDPANQNCYLNLSYYRLYTGNFVEAEQALRKASDLFSSANVYFPLGVALMGMGRPADALDEFRMDPDQSSQRQGAALAYFALHRKSEADAALSAMLLLDKDSHPDSIAKVYAYRGELDQAFLWLERAYQHRKDQLLGFNRDPLLSLLGPLRSDPRWKPFLQKLGQNP
jgi:TolB-like protein